MCFEDSAVARKTRDVGDRCRHHISIAHKEERSLNESEFNIAGEAIQDESAVSRIHGGVVQSVSHCGAGGCSAECDTLQN